MSPEEMDEYLAEHGDECEQHGPDCEDEDCITVEQEFNAAAIDSDVESGILTDRESITAHAENGTWEPNPEVADAGTGHGPYEYRSGN